MNAKISNYLNALESGLINTTSLKILDYTKNNEVTTVYHLRKNLNHPHQTITSALSILMDDGLIYEVGTTTVNMRQYSLLKFTDDPGYIQTNQNRRLNIKKLRWLNKIEEMNLPPMMEKSLIEYRNKLQLVSDFKNWNHITPVQ